MDASSEHLVRAELVRMREEARYVIHRGVALIAVVPLVLIAAVIAAFALGGFGAFMSILLAATYLLVGSIAGIGMIVGGVTDHRRCTRQLRELEAVHQLPEARVIVRS
jgi:phosphate/sulfate permease